MIKDKDSFEAIDTMLKSEGWSIFAKFIEQKGKSSKKNALDAKEDRERSRHLDEYKTLRYILETIYGAYQTEYERYKGASNE